MTHFCATADADLALVALGRELACAGYGFTTPSPATQARVNARPGATWATSLRDIFGWSRPFRAGVVAPDIFALMQRARILRAHEDGWRSTVRVSSLNRALFFHSAFPTHEGDAVFFGPDTYRFARAIIAHLTHTGPVARALDVCSGAGPGGIIIAQARDEAEVLLADVNPQALRLSQINAALAAAPRVTAVHSDLFSATKGVFDLIVANPPYLVDPAERTYRHGGGALGAQLSTAILQGALSRLAHGGTLLLYTGSAVVDGCDMFAQAVAAQLAGHDMTWSYEELDPDVFGEELACAPYNAADRIAAVLLTARR